MKKILKGILFFSAILFLFSSCNNYRAIKLESFDIKNVKVKNFTNAEILISFKINNPSSRTYKITKLAGDIYVNNNNFATYNLKNIVQIDPKSVLDINAIIFVKVPDLLKMFSMDIDLNHLDKTDVQVEGKIVFKNDLGIKTSKRFKNISVSRWIKSNK
ncbi:MAG: hypothetical protein WC140_03855 [Bacteroidales bacterium]